MAIRDIFKVSRKTFINPSSWIDYNTLRAQNRTLWNIISDLFTPAKSTRQESFKQAVARLKLSEADIKDTIRSYRNYSLSFVLLGVLSLIYAGYLMAVLHSIPGLVLGILVSLFLFAQAFRYSFWAYQMHTRRLGVTFKEWKQHLLGGKKTND